jgi:hypothetical protein
VKIGVDEGVRDAVSMCEWVGWDRQRTKTNRRMLEFVVWTVCIKFGWPVGVAGWAGAPAVVALAEESLDGPAPGEDAGTGDGRLDSGAGDDLGGLALGTGVGASSAAVESSLSGLERPLSAPSAARVGEDGLEPAPGRARGGAGQCGAGARSTWIIAICGGQQAR